MKKSVFVCSMVMLLFAAGALAQNPTGWWVYPDGRKIPVYDNPPVNQQPVVYQTNQPNGVQTASLITNIAHFAYDVSMDWLPSPRNGFNRFGNTWNQNWGWGNSWNNNWNQGWGWNNNIWNQNRVPTNTNPYFGTGVFRW